MKDARLWIVLLAFVCFLTGASAAVLAERLGTIEAERGPFAAYADALVADFDLSPERAAHLRVVLREYAEEIERIRVSHEMEFYASLEEELRPKGAEYNRLIRDVVLPPSQRARFDSLALEPAGS
jgi:hypothetical protein